MGLGDKIQETVGKAKENVGEAVGNQDLRAEGQGDRGPGGLVISRRLPQNSSSSSTPLRK